MLLFVNNLHEKRITESQDSKNFGSVHMLFVIGTLVTTLYECYMKNAPFFSQSDAHDFLMYIIGVGKAFT